MATLAQDRTIKLWDVRAGAGPQRSLGTISIRPAPRFTASMEWSRTDPLCLVVSEPNDTVHVYDVRKLAGGSGTGSIVRSFALWPQRVESCRFSPNGEYLVAATTPLGGEGMGELRVWPYETTTTFVGKKKQPKSKDGSLGEPPQRVVSFPGHTGPIVDFCFSPDGKRLATGGSDAIVGLWNVNDMVCTRTITRRTKYIRSVAFSHDSKLLASTSEEDGVDLAHAANGQYIQTIQLGNSNNNSTGGNNNNNSNGGGGAMRLGGADEIDFHPRQHVLACARGDFSGTMGPPVVIARLKI